MYGARTEKHLFANRCFSVLAPYIHHMLRCVVALVILAGVGVGQGVVLPEATGELMPGAEWTVLRAAEMAQPERATDPQGKVARRMIQATVAELQAKERSEQHLLLHRIGTDPDDLQLIHCYSADVRAASSELLKDAAIEQIRDASTTELSSADLPVICTGSETSELWPVPSLLLHFQHEDSESPWRMDMQIVPAGDRLQYFETQYMAGDVTAVANIQ